MSWAVTQSHVGIFPDDVDQPGDALVQLVEREEGLVAEACQDPALRDEHADLDLGLVARMLWARRRDDGAVVPARS